MVMARKILVNGMFNYYHNGLDIANKSGTAVLAANAGKVIFAVSLDVRGTHCHRSWPRSSLGLFPFADILVKKSAWVAKGRLIGRLGESGMATGPHLH